MAKKITRKTLLDMLLLSALVLLMALPGLANLPVIDRDEARYAQASIQMLESGDYINIRFQDDARNKKPAGSYWLQAVSVKIFSDVNSRDIWAHRLPSVLAALIAVLATYWGGRLMLGRETARMGAAFLAISLLFVFEAHIAKTDALLCACAAVVLAAMAHLRNGGGRKPALVFWLALGVGVMVKGPLILLLVGLAIVTLLVWERKSDWLKPLGFWLGPALFLLIILPWGVLIWHETGGAFFREALGDDLGPKLKGGHESHGGPPGYYALTIWLFFWPASLFLLPALALAIRAVSHKKQKTSPLASSFRLLLAWAIPFWLILEIIPTKLPHYPLPIYPALALMAGAGVLAISKLDAFPRLRRLGSVIFVVFSLALMTGILFAQAYYGNYPTWSFVVMAIAILLALFSAVMVWRGRAQKAFISVLAVGVLVSLPTYQFILPSMGSLQIARQVQSVLHSHNITTPLNAKTQLFSPQFTEPSLVYRLGSHILLGKADERLASLKPNHGDLIILDHAREQTQALAAQLSQLFETQNICTQSLGRAQGVNYAKGDPVNLEILQTQACPESSEP